MPNIIKGDFVTSKKLSMVQTLAKVGKILSISGLVISVLGVIGCIFNFGFSGPVMAYRDAEGAHIFREFPGGPIEITEEGRVAAFAALLIIYAAWTAVAVFAVKYFNNELIEGTPFTFCGADEMKVLAIVTVTVPTVAKALAWVILEIFTDGEIIDISYIDGVFITGLMFFVMSSVFRYGAVLRDEIIASLHGQPQIAPGDEDGTSKREAVGEEALGKIKGYARKGMGVSILIAVMSIMCTVVCLILLSVTDTEWQNDSSILGGTDANDVCLVLMFVSMASVAVFATRYFRRELARGNPFTLSGAEKIKRLGIITVVAGIVQGIILRFMLSDFIGGFIVLGIMFIAMSVIFRYGAELREEKEKNPLG